MMDEKDSPDDRVEHLVKLCGLQVSCKKMSHKREGNWQNLNYYEFFHEGKVMASFCTYPKAKAFAEGVAVGRKL